MIDDTFEDVETIRRAFPDIFIAWSRSIYGGLDLDKDYYDLIIIDMEGTGYDSKMLEEMDLPSVIITSGGSRPLSDRYQFVEKTSDGLGMLVAAIGHTITLKEIEGITSDKS